MDEKGKFRAEMLLKLRRRREGIVRRHFSRAAGEMDATARRLAALREALDEHTRSLQEMLATAPDAMNVRLYRQCIADLQVAIAEQESLLADEQETLERQREGLTEAIRQRKALELLKGRQDARYVAVRRHGEAKQWDQLHAAHRAGDAATKGGEA